MYGLMIPGPQPPVPVCDEPWTGAPEPAPPAAVEPGPERAPWPAPPRPVEREADPEC